VTVRGGISSRPNGWDVRHVPETGSTNTDLLEAAERGDAGDRTVLRADHQTAGRGRLDRRWDAPPGTNLLVTLLSTDAGASPSTLMQRVGLAAVAAVEAAVGTSLPDRLGLKWPNDVLLDDAKLAGVLAQRSTTTGAVVVGIGLNVGWAPDGFSSLSSNLGCDVSPAALLDLLLERFDDERDVGERYRERLMTLGRTVRVELPGNRILDGVARDVDPSGRIVIESHGERHVLDVGDVIHLRT